MGFAWNIQNTWIRICIYISWVLVWSFSYAIYIFIQFFAKGVCCCPPGIYETIFLFTFVFLFFFFFINTCGFSYATPRSEKKKTHTKLSLCEYSSWINSEIQRMQIEIWKLYFSFTLNYLFFILRFSVHL